MPNLTIPEMSPDEARRVLGVQYFEQVTREHGAVAMGRAIAAFEMGNYDRVLAIIAAAKVGVDARQAAVRAASEALTKESAPLARCCTFSGGEPHPVALDADGHCIYCGFGACGDDDGAGGGA